MQQTPPKNCQKTIWREWKYTTDIDYGEHLSTRRPVNRIPIPFPLEKQAFARLFSKRVKIQSMILLVAFGTVIGYCCTLAIP